MTDHEGVIARLESAEAGSDELSAIVVQSLVVPAGFVEQSHINGAWCIYDGTRTAHGVSRLWEKRGWHRPEGWPVTTSLDAALALAERVLPGWCWELTLMPGEATWQGAPEMWPEGLAAPDRGGVYASTKTPALALCIAILKARASDTLSSAAGSLGDGEG